VQRVLAERWGGVPVTSIKGALGHAMAAAGALQAITAVRSLQTGIVPPTVNLREPDDDCVLDHVVGRARELDVPVVLVNSFGMGGQNACAIYARAGANIR
jgi:3-oxoacyl-[acyl-carrier-protein] synthase II